MGDEIEIPITYKGEELSFKANIVTYGFIHKIEVQLNDHLIILEQDEEQLYRASMDAYSEVKLSYEEKELLNEIVIVLHSLS